MDGGRTGLIEAARAFAARELAPQAARWERERTFPREALRAAAAAGLTQLRMPGRGLVEVCQVVEALAAEDYAFTFALSCHSGAAGTLARAGLDPGPLLRADEVGAFCLTEPGAGTDAAAISTAARSGGDGWRIDGVKAWVTNGVAASVLQVYAQTEPGAGHRGIAGFVVQGPQPGLSAGPSYGLTGGNAMGLSDVRFEDCAALVFAPPGEGFKAALRGIDSARAIVAAMCCGMLGRGLEVAVAHVKQRRAFGRPLAEFQALQWALADAATDLEAARRLTYAAAAAIDEGAADGGVAAAHAKKFAPAAALRHLAVCVQALGAEGLKDDHPLARHLACAKMAQIQDGTNEVQNLVIARSLM